MKYISPADGLQLINIPFSRHAAAFQETLLANGGSVIALPGSSLVRVVVTLDLLLQPTMRLRYNSQSSLRRKVSSDARQQFISPLTPPPPLPHFSTNGSNSASVKVFLGPVPCLCVRSTHASITSKLSRNLESNKLESRRCSCAIEYVMSTRLWCS